MSSIRRPRNGIDTIGMTTIGEQCGSGDYIPHSYDVIPGARGDTRSIRRPCQGIDAIAMIAIDESRLLPAYIQDMNSCIISTGSNVVTIRRPAHRIDPVYMIAVGKLLLKVERGTLFYLPYPHRLIIAAISKILTVWRPR
jgi:hypothetical protein